MAKIRVFVKTPGSEHVAMMSIDNKLEAFQELVKGYIEVVAVDVSSNLVMIVNEEGKLNRLPGNFMWQGDYIVGNAVFARVDGEEFADVREEDRVTIEDAIEMQGFID